jgi:hypothetical protein
MRSLSRSAGWAPGGLRREHRELGAVASGWERDAHSSGKRLAASPNGSSSSRSAARRHRARARGGTRRHRILAAERIGPPAADLQRHCPAMVAAAERRARSWALKCRVPGPGRAGARSCRCERRRVLCRWGYMLVPEPSVALSETRARPPAGGRVALAVWASADENPWASAVGRVLVARGVQGLRSGCARAFQLPIRSEYAAWWRMLASSFSRRRTFRSRGGTKASTIWKTTLDLSSALVARGRAALDERRRRQHSSRTFAEPSSPTSTAASSSSQVGSSHTRAPRLALR